MPADASRSGPHRQQAPAGAAGVALCLLAALAAAGCGGPDVPGGPEPAASADAGRRPGADPAGGEATFRGLLTSGPTARTFTACGRAEPVGLTDRTGGRLDEVYRALADRPYDPVFVEFRGYPAPPPRGGGRGDGAGPEARVVALALRHAATDGAAGCDDQMGGAAVRAFGGEPPWRLDIAESGIALTEADSVHDTVFPYAPPLGPPGRRVYAAGTDGPEPHRIEVVIEEKPCADPASGAYFALTAEVRVDGGPALTGCARENWR